MSQRRGQVPCSSGRLWVARREKYFPSGEDGEVEAGVSRTSVEDESGWSW